MGGDFEVTRGLVLCLTFALLAPAARADTFPLYGFGDNPLEPGVLATEASITSAPVGLARRADGVVAFASGGRAFWIHHGRLLRVPLQVSETGDLELAFAPDGSLLVASCPIAGRGPAAVFRTAPGVAPTVVAGRLGSRGSTGDGGPATRARLRCAAGVAVDREGGILIADSFSRRVRRVDPGGTITTVAGTGRGGSSGDGGPAVRARIGLPVAVAALPDGGFAIADAGTRAAIRAVDAAGTISTRARTAASGIAAEPDGSLLLVHGDHDALVRRLAPDGRESVVVDHRDDLVPALDRNPLQGRLLPGRQVFEDSYVQTDAAVPTPDGGMLLAADFGISYVAAEQPQVLAVAIARETFRVRPGLTAAVRVTRPARVTVEVWRGDRIRAATAVEVPAGESLIPVPHELPGGEYLVRVQAEDADQIVADHASVLVGTALTRAFARAAIERSLVFVQGLAKPGRCRRKGARRVDCTLREQRRRLGTAVVRLADDGTVRLSSRRR